jgi:TPR repeat protein
MIKYLAIIAAGMIIFLDCKSTVQSQKNDNLNFHIEAKTLKLPEDYIQFLEANRNEAIHKNLAHGYWTFWNWDTAKTKTEEFRKNKKIKANDFAVGVNQDNEPMILVQKNDGAYASQLFFYGNSDGERYYAFHNFLEFKNYEYTQVLIQSIDSLEHENQDLTTIENCAGSLFEYAEKLMTSPYDENFSATRNKKAANIYEKAAALGQFCAPNALANYYYFQDEVDIEKVKFWWEKSIALGCLEDVYEYADFLIDNSPKDIDKAIELLESLVDTNLYKGHPDLGIVIGCPFMMGRKWHRKRAILKLGRTLMSGEGGKKDYKKGLYYTRIGADEKNPHSMADLAFYYYQGMGVEKDIQKAYDLLVAAEKKQIEERGSGNWEMFIKKLANELGIKE